MERSNYNRGSNGGGRGSYGGGRGGNHPHQQNHQRQSGGGGGRGRGRGQHWVNRTDQIGQGGGRAYWHQPQNIQGAGSTRVEPFEEYGRGGYSRGGGGGAGGRGGGRASQFQPQYDQVEPFEEYGSGGYGGGSGSGGGGRRGGGREWSGRGSQSQPTSQFPVSRGVPQHILPDIESLKILEQKPPLAFQESTENRLVPIKRPDKGGTVFIKSMTLSANHFLVTFHPETTIMHYNVDITPRMSPGARPLQKSIPKSVLRLVMDELFSNDPARFPGELTAYDGEKNIFSAVQLTTGLVEFSGGEELRNRSYTLNIKFVNELKYSKLRDYLTGKHPYIPRDILQGMDLAMKVNPSRRRISRGRSFYSKKLTAKNDLNCGVSAAIGFQQSLKPTSQGLASCLDSSVLAFRKGLPVIDFLKEHVRGFQKPSDVRRLLGPVTKALKILEVTVNHRNTRQKYVIAGLTKEDTQDITFPLQDSEGNPLGEIGLVEFFRRKYKKDIMYKDIPCLDLGENNRKNYVPMEFCVLVEGQRYPKEQLDRERGLLLKKISMPAPFERKNTICEMLQADDGPRGDVVQNFGMTVDKNMTRVLGRVIGPPALKLCTPTGSLVRVDKEKCQWNLVGKAFVNCKPLNRWAFIEFSSFNRSRLDRDVFIQNLREKYQKLGGLMEMPVVKRLTDMQLFSSVALIRELLDSVVEEAKKGKCMDRLQLIVCVMSGRHEGYKYLKWVSETQIGVLTQCCLANNATSNRGIDQFLANLSKKINAKLGGSNAELFDRLPGFEGDEHVMFVGADVNHPAALNITCPSIAAVVATLNWPAANRYAARVLPQAHRKEKIVNFGAMCLDLVNAYCQLNKVKPKKIVVFRDGVSEGQFDMVLNEELLDLKRTIYEEDYHPTVTVIVAQKRHLTRLFVENERDGGVSGNIPPGTIVDTTIVHPFEYDFYLCSHYGSIGTSKPAHYYILFDEHNLTSDQSQKLIYDLCFTFARCTKPVSLVTPVYYADLAAYRGRLYQESVMDLQQPPNSSSSWSPTSLNEGLYNLHPDLQNDMFFI